MKKLTLDLRINTRSLNTNMNAKAHYYKRERIPFRTEIHTIVDAPRPPNPHEYTVLMQSCFSELLVL